MLQQTLEVRIRSGVAQLPPEQVEYGSGALSVDMLFLKLPGQLLLVLVPHHLEKVQVSVQGLVLVLPELVDDGLDAQHQ